MTGGTTSPSCDESSITQIGSIIPAISGTWILCEPRGRGLGSVDEDREVAGAFLGKGKQQCPHPREGRPSTQSAGAMPTLPLIIQLLLEKS